MSGDFMSDALPGETVEQYVQRKQGGTTGTTTSPYKPASAGNVGTNDPSQRFVDTGATPPSGMRPTGNSQFYQPIYKPSYGPDARLPGQRYLQSNPDVNDYYRNNQQSIGSNSEDFARQHYQNYGQNEGRAWPSAAPVSTPFSYNTQNAAGPVNSGQSINSLAQMLQALQAGRQPVAPQASLSMPVQAPGSYTMPSATAMQPNQGIAALDQPQ